MTRHELKEQVQHDQFTDFFSQAIQYTSENREKIVRWGIAVVIVLALVGAGFWYASYQQGIRQQDLQAAFDVWETPVGPAAQPGQKSFPTEAAKREAAAKAFSQVVSKDSGSREGRIAQYYRGTIEAASQDNASAERDLKAVADSGKEFSALAKIALANIYAGENRLSDGRALLESVVNKPTDLVSKAQADLILAQLEVSSNPQDAKRILKTLQTPNQDPAVARAADQVSAQLPK